MKKRIFIISVIILWLGGTYVIGQTLHGERVNDVLEATTAEIATSGVPVGGQTSSDNTNQWNDYVFQFEGVTQNADNPWGVTAGIIDMESEGEVLFLTPNTSVTFEVEVSENVEFKAKIHPWMQEVSDGAGIVIWYLDADDTIIEQEELYFSNIDEWKSFQLHSGDLKDASKVKILCNNGKNNDNSGDWIVIRKNDNDTSIFGADGYVKSVTYFADEWPVNFWNSEMDHLEEDLDQIRNDGFDSIILVIPWREFQPQVSPITYNDYAFEKLDEVMKAADRAGLFVYARIGYTWDFYNDVNESVLDRFLSLLMDDETRKAWCDYAKTMYGKLSSYSNFKDSFLTWEDFWEGLSVCEIENDAERVRYASEIGYHEWLRKNYPLDDYNQLFDTEFTSYEEIPVPHRNEPSMEAMYQFFDEYLKEILRMTQKVFPNCSMEVRMDADLVYKADGTQEYYSHKTTYACENSDFTAIMYGIPMGCENNGENCHTKKQFLTHPIYWNN